MILSVVNWSLKMPVWRYERETDIEFLFDITPEQLFTYYPKPVPVYEPD